MFSLLIAQATTAITEGTEVVEKVLAADIAEGAMQSASHGSIWAGVMSSDPIVKICLIVLLGFSVGCWAVIFFKLYQLRNALNFAQSFWNKFSAVNSISEIEDKKILRRGPMYEIYASGTSMMNQIRKSAKSPLECHRNMVMQRVSQAKEEEVYKLEQYVGFLATTASVAPFIGLLGTVWGILTAFMAIGKAGSSSLATVGPYISEALVATAVGLFAAIPAVVAYNYFVGKIKIISKMIDLFIDDFMLKTEMELAP